VNASQPADGLKERDVDIALPRIEILENSDTRAQFEIEPLQRGYGVTLGNALRRVLLSSLPGAAITAVQIDGARHEFTDLPGIREDVTEIILNLKKIRLKLHGDEPVHLILEATGEGPVTAGDIHLTDRVEIINPEQHIATIDSPNGKLTAELLVERGVGYHDTSNLTEPLPIGQIPVDGIFSPIRRVNFTVEHTRVGQMTNYERLLLDINTDGTITPQEALTQAAEMLTQYFAHIASIGEGGAATQKLPSNKQPLSRRPLPPREYDLAIEDLNLSPRSLNALRRAGILKVGQLVSMTPEDLLSIRNFGQKSLEELVDRLRMRRVLDGFGG
jgi:DNA-directed RNA polymerase subunit alpha